MSKQNLTPAFGLLAKSTDIIKRNLGTFFVLLVVPLLLSSLTGTPPTLPDNPTVRDIFDQATGTITPYVAIGSFLSLIFFAPLIYTELRTAGGKLVSLSESFKGYKYFWRLLGLSILVAIIVALGFVALIIPGFIMLRRYVLAPYFLIDKDLSITEAMSTAAKATKPVSWSIYSILAVTFLFGVVTGFGVLGLIAGTILQVLYSVALALRYQEIKKL